MRNELEGYKEATAGPSSHKCHNCKLVDATISRRCITPSAGTRSFSSRTA